MLVEKFQFIVIIANIIEFTTNGILEIFSNGYMRQLYNHLIRTANTDVKLLLIIK